MDTKLGFIQRYYSLSEQINQKLEEKERYRARAEKTTQTLTGMPHGGSGEDQRELAICNMVDCDTEANQLIDELVFLRDQIRYYIAQTGDNDERLLVVLRV